MTGERLKTSKRIERVLAALCVFCFMLVVVGLAVLAAWAF